MQKFTPVYLKREYKKFVYEEDSDKSLNYVSTDDPNYVIPNSIKKEYDFPIEVFIVSRFENNQNSIYDYLHYSAPINQNYIFIDPQFMYDDMSYIQFCFKKNSIQYHKIYLPAPIVQLSQFITVNFFTYLDKSLITDCSDLCYPNKDTTLKR